MPITHIVLFKLKPEITAEARAGFLATAEEQLASIPFGTRAVMGPPMFNERAGGFDIGLYREFKDEEEFQAYRVHPTHMALITGLVAETVENLLSFQIQS